MLRFAGIIVASVIAAMPIAAAEPAPKERTWKVDGVERQALVYAPVAAKSAKAPVVFAFHGHGGSMTQAARSFGYHTIWPETIVVYMHGLNTPGKLTDPEGKKAGWQHSSGDQQDRDLKFFDAVLASLKADDQVDERRIYSTGHSNGGGFTYLLWAQRGDVFAAVAPSAAGASGGLKNLKSKPAMHIAGTADPLVKFENQQRTMDAVRKLNQCTDAGTEWAKVGSLVGTKYPSPAGTPFVTLISPGDHKFPEGAPKLIVKFFQEHAKP